MPNSISNSICINADRLVSCDFYLPLVFCVNFISLWRFTSVFYLKYRFLFFSAKFLMFKLFLLLSLHIHSIFKSEMLMFQLIVHRWQSTWLLITNKIDDFTTITPDWFALEHLKFPFHSEGDCSIGLFVIVQNAHSKNSFSFCWYTFDS